MKVKKSISKVSSKGQIVLPKEVRATLHIKPGDFLEYEIKDNVVTLHRLEPFDHHFYSALSDTLTEWSSVSDDQAFNDL